jgi:hypothetical protein
MRLNKVMIWGNLVEQIQKSATKLPFEEFDKLFFKDVRKGMAKVLETQRKGTHVTDITSCPRKQAYRTFDTDYIPDEAATQYMMTGKAMHAVVQDIAPHVDRQKYDIEKEINHDGLLGHIDMFNKELNMPIEMKGVRQNLTEMLQYGPSDGYLIQLAIYLATTKAPKGLLYYNLLGQKGKDFHHGYQLELSDPLRIGLMREVKRIKENYERAIAQKNPELADAVYDHPDLEFQCMNCPYADEIRCKEGYKTKIRRLKVKAEREARYAKGYPKRKAVVERKSQIIKPVESLIKTLTTMNNSPKFLKDWTEEEKSHVNIVG